MKQPERWWSSQESIRESRRGGYSASAEGDDDSSPKKIKRRVRGFDSIERSVEWEEVKEPQKPIEKVTEKIDQVKEDLEKKMRE